MHIYQSKFIELYNKQDQNLTELEKLLRVDCKSCEDCRINLLLDYTSTRWFIVLSIVLTQYYFQLNTSIKDFSYIRELVKLHAELLFKEDKTEVKDSVIRYIELRQQLIKYLYDNEVFSNRSR